MKYSYSDFRMYFHSQNKIFSLRLHLFQEKRNTDTKLTFVTKTYRQSIQGIYESECETVETFQESQKVFKTANLLLTT